MRRIVGSLGYMQLPDRLTSQQRHFCRDAPRTILQLLDYVDELELRNELLKEKIYEGEEIEITETDCTESKD